MRYAAAVVLWVAAWGCAGLIPASFFPARDGKRDVAQAMLICGFTGAAGFGYAGAVAW